MTEVCVSTTSLGAKDGKFNVVAVSKACASLSGAWPRVNVETLQVFGRIRTTTAVIDCMRACVRLV